MKILVIRFSSIGDIVLTTPVIRCIKQQRKDVEIHYLVKEAHADILRNNPHVDKVYAIKKGMKEVVAELRAEKYDLILDLHHNLRAAEALFLLKRKWRSVNKWNVTKLAMVDLKIKWLPLPHIVDRCFKPAEVLGIKNDNAGLDYFIPQKDEIDLSSLPSEFQNGYIGFVIGAKAFTKQLPAEKIISIIQQLNQPVILLGGKEDIKKADLIISQLPTTNSRLVLNACGKYNLNQSASLVKQATKIITNDTGLMHIAAAFKKEIISLWGNTVPEFGMYPYYGKENVKWHKVEVKNLSCRPCSRLGYDKCPKGHFKCMMKINEQEVVKLTQS